MAALTGNKIKDSYLGLLKTTNSGILTSNFVRITDGGGNNTQLYLSNAAIRFYDAYTFPSADGTSGQVLSTDGSGTLYFTESSDNQTLEEVLTSGNTATLAILSTADGNTFGSTTFDAAVTGTTANFTTSVTSPSFIGDIDGALIQQVKAAETLVKGDVVYISGGTGDNPEVSKAKADSSTTMAALGIIKNNIAEDDVGECITSGELTGLGTLLGSFATGDDLYVSATTAGALVTTAPTGVTNLIQKIGKVIKGGNGGALTVLGAFRVNASPNLPTGILLGDTTNVSTAITDGSVGQILSTDGSGSYSFIDNDEGTVTSVALSVPTGLTVTNSPITTSGTIAIGGTLGVANGGTGATTLTGILVGNGTSAISVVSDGIVSGQVLSTNANGTYSFIDAAGGDVTKTGGITANQIAVWNDSTDELRSDETVTIGTDHSITLYQPNTNSITTNYIIGGGSSMTTGELNTGFGSSVLTLNTTGIGNIAIGSDSLTTNVSGYNNVAVGVNTLKRTTASNNVAIGNSVLQFDTTGYENTAIGGLSQYHLTTAYGNTSLGYNSLIYNSTGIQNTAIGWNSLKGLSTYSASNNTALGSNSGSAITTGSYNVIIGSNTGSTIATSSSNIIISDGSGTIRQSFDFTGAATFSNQLKINAGNGNQLYLNNSGEQYTQITFDHNTSGSSQAYLAWDNTNSFFEMYAKSGGGLKFFTNATERMRISSGGAATFSTNSNSSIVNHFTNSDTTNTSTRNTIELTAGNRFLQLQAYNADHIYFNRSSGSNLYFQSGGSTQMLISSGGAATFSSSVTASGGYYYGQSTNSFVRLDNTIGSQIGYNNYAYSLYDSNGVSFYTAVNATPTLKLNISSGGNVTITQPTNGNDAVLNLTAKSAGGNTRTTSLTYDADTEKLIINNAGTEILRMGSSTGVIESNYGIAFPNQSAGSGAVSSSTLDAYEEGTWDATLTATAGGGTFNLSPSYNSGTYTRIGNTVTVTSYLYLSLPNTGTPTGYAVIGGLPFTSASSTPSYTSCSVFAQSLDSGASGSLMAIVYTNSTTIGIYRYQNGVAGVSANYIKQYSELIISATYQI